MTLSEYIKDRLIECDSATSEECRDIIGGMEYMRESVGRWGVAAITKHSDEWYEMQGFLDDILCQLDRAIIKAERILAEVQEEESEDQTPNYSDVEYRH